MIAEYFIYRRKGDKEPFISLGEIPQYGLRPKQKFTGKKLKIEAVSYTHLHNNTQKLMYDTSLLVFQSEIPDQVYKEPEYGLNLYPLAERCV